MNRKGFTIVELLIVIVVIGILAAITVVAFNGVQTRAQESKIKSDISQLKKAIQAARLSNNTTLGGVTGVWSTGGNCANQASGTNLATLDQAAHACWTTYRAALNAISTASGIDVRNIKDPWGRPYLIDENEGEGAGNCTRDSIAAFTMPFVTGWYAYSSTSLNDMERSGATGCAI